MLFSAAVAELGAGRHAAAEQKLREVLAILPDNPQVLTNLAGALFLQDKFAQARECAEQVLAAQPNDVRNLIVLADCLFQEKNYNAALPVCDRLIALQPNVAEFHGNRGSALAHQHRFEEAIVSFQRALALDPNAVNTLVSYANALRRLAEYGSISQALLRAVPDPYAAALAACDRAIARKPDSAEAWFCRGILFHRSGDDSEALACFDRAFAINPDLPQLESLRLNAKLFLCDWSGYEQETQRLAARVRGGAVISPFVFAALPGTPADQLACARAFDRSEVLKAARLDPLRPRIAGGKIRVGYVSADFRQHPMAYLLAGVIEEHDRSQFEVVGISIGPQTDDAAGLRIRGAFDRFADIFLHSYAEAIRQIRALDLDIAVDLNGYTDLCRPELFAARIAPLQVSYLGFPATMGADHMDYLVADPIVVPAQDRQHYAEKIVWMPHSYQANDAKRAISDKPMSRAQYGLPPAGFVFCCFNSHYKIRPDVFASWMRIMSRVPDSVLWLMQGNAAALDNLRRHATVAGVDPQRLVFAPPLPVEEHLARHRLADLSLDTLPYNAHTTTSDALWAGLPVVTRAGNTFAGRVAASLLSAIGLPELITYEPQEYEDLAVALAADPGRLAAIRQQLARNRLAAPLFDTARFTRHLEQAYRTMTQRQRAGLAPDHFAVEP
ncbi:MAG TPA: tetratricopeptide repeat protein [Pseudorhodoplanes sp.]|nr:tetratricopeptide repeat protein [Pseudorhodoplanes sp.]